jgi:hypothetical protein
MNGKCADGTVSLFPNFTRVNQVNRGTRPASLDLSGQFANSSRHLLRMSHALGALFCKLVQQLGTNVHSHYFITTSSNTSRYTVHRLQLLQVDKHVLLVYVHASVVGHFHTNLRPGTLIAGQLFNMEVYWLELNDRLRNTTPTNM